MEIAEIIENFNPVAVKFNTQKDAVLVKDRNTKMTFWMDIEESEDGEELICDWNQYIFFLTDADDVLRKELQENIDIFEMVSSVAMEFYENNK